MFLKDKYYVLDLKDKMSHHSWKRIDYFGHSDLKLQGQCNGQWEYLLDFPYQWAYHSIIRLFLVLRKVQKCCFRTTTMKTKEKKLLLLKGAFNNYVDQILSIFDPLPPSSGQAWTFYIPPPPVDVDKRWTNIKYQHLTHSNQHNTYMGKFAQTSN